MTIHGIRGIFRRNPIGVRSTPISAAVLLALASLTTAAEPVRFPTIPPEHKHARMLLENAMHYVGPANKIVDAASGYPFEGWNHDPKRGVYLRAFTQLTAIGFYMELLGNVVAGVADTPDLPRDRALEQLTKLVATLRQDQQDPKLSARGLVSNFLDLASGKRLSPLAEDVPKSVFLDAFGPDRGDSIWKALASKGWIVPQNNGREASIVRDNKFGYEHFNGELARFADDATRQKVMALLDRRVVLVIFGDNSNLTTSAARTIGALLLPEAASKPGVSQIRAELEAFLEAQREGYASLFDAKAGLFHFGWDATKGRHFGWEDAQGVWTTGHMDYLVNEFRGPTTFVTARFGLPAEAIRNLGFKMKPYRTASGSTLYAMAPWEGSAFQAFGLAISPGDLEGPSWRQLLGNVVDIETDFAARKGLPGFLSESYTGRGVEYTGQVGIPDITVSPKPRITDAASLYTLGVAYSVAPSKVEAFLGANWPAISGLLTDHGPWEGDNISMHETIRFETTAHTLSLTLGLLGTGPGNLKRYAESKGFAAGLDSFYPMGLGGDLLSGDEDVFAWGNKDGKVEGSRQGTSFSVKGDRLHQLGIAFVPKSKSGLNASGGVLKLNYRSDKAVDPLLITFKPIDPIPGLISKDIFARLEPTEDGEIRVPLPAAIGLSRVKEVVLYHEGPPDPRSVDLSIKSFKIVPNVGQK